MLPGPLFAVCCVVTHQIYLHFGGGYSVFCSIVDCKLETMAEVECAGGDTERNSVILLRQWYCA